MASRKSSSVQKRITPKQQKDPHLSVKIAASLSTPNSLPLSANKEIFVSKFLAQISTSIIAQNGSSRYSEADRAPSEQVLLLDRVTEVAL